MRKILFRGKTEKGEWKEGCLIYKISSVGNKILSLIACSAEWETESEFFHLCNTHWIIPETIGQYTGLTDKNGTKIFEGDILSEIPPMNQTGYIGYVSYDEELAVWRFMIKNDTKYNGVLLGSYSNSYKVIGNIHDNPELLGVTPMKEMNKEKTKCPNRGKVLRKKYHNEAQIRAERERRKKGGDTNE